MEKKRQFGSILGIPFYLDSSWFLILGLVTLVNAGEINGGVLQGNSPWLGWLLGFVMALLLFGSVLLHELGHSLVARSQGITVNSITLFLFGGVASIERESKTPMGAFSVAIAGPLVSFALGILFFTLGNLNQESALLSYLTDDLSRINLFLGFFNLIPGLPLDGGQVLKALIWKISGDRFTGVRWAARSGKFMGGLGLGLGLLVILSFGDFSGAWLALIGWFVWRNADAYDRLMDLQDSLLSILAAEVMTRNFRVIDANLTLKEFIDTYMVKNPQENCLYYAASEGRYRGLVRLETLQNIERSEWDWLTLKDIAQPLTEIPSVSEKTPLVTVVDLLEKNSFSDRILTVLSPAGAVAGVIDRGDIIKVLALKHKIPIPDTEIQRIKTEGTYPPFLPLATLIKNLNPK
jgi:Zn-dependent protease